MREGEKEEPLYLHCARAIDLTLEKGAHGLPLMGGGDWRLAAAVGFVLGVGRVLTGFLFMSVALLLASLVMRAFPALRQSAAKKQPLVPYFAVAFIPAYFL